jgi:hypothetical protein
MEDRYPRRGDLGAGMERVVLRTCDWHDGKIWWPVFTG